MSFIRSLEQNLIYSSTTKILAGFFLFFFLFINAVTVHYKKCFVALFQLLSLHTYIDSVVPNNKVLALKHFSTWINGISDKRNSFKGFRVFWF